jgi:uncharacterized protein (DUF2141 family)
MKIILLFYLINSLLTGYSTREISSPGSAAFQKGTYDIELTISNIKNKSGLIQVGVFITEKGYPDKPEYSFTLAKDTIKSGLLRMSIPVKEARYYGISILDDENKNGKMDYVLVIKPKEGFGFSNNPRIKGLRAPSFESTKFMVSGAKIRINVRMVYI